jgi:hypothetical protein
VTKSTLIPVTSLAAGAATVLPVAYDDGSTPTLGFARLLVTIADVPGDGALKRVHLRITASLSDWRWRALEDLDPASAEIITEIHRRWAPPPPDDGDD